MSDTVQGALTGSAETSTATEAPSITASVPEAATTVSEAATPPPTPESTPATPEAPDPAPVAAASESAPTEAVEIAQSASELAAGAPSEATASTTAKTTDTLTEGATRSSDAESVTRDAGSEATSVSVEQVADTAESAASAASSTVLDSGNRVTASAADTSAEAATLVTTQTAHTAEQADATATVTTPASELADTVATAPTSLTPAARDTVDRLTTEAVTSDVASSVGATAAGVVDGIAAPVADTSNAVAAAAARSASNGGDAVTAPITNIAANLSDGTAGLSADAIARAAALGDGGSQTLADAAMGPPPALASPSDSLLRPSTGYPAVFPDDNALTALGEREGDALGTAPTPLFEAADSVTGAATRLDRAIDQLSSPVSFPPSSVSTLELANPESSTLPPTVDGGMLTESVPWSGALAAPDVATTDTAPVAFPAGATNAFDPSTGPLLSPVDDAATGMATPPSADARELVIGSVAGEGSQSTEAFAGPSVFGFAPADDIPATSPTGAGQGFGDAVGFLAEGHGGAGTVLDAVPNHASGSSIDVDAAVQMLAEAVGGPSVLLPAAILTVAGASVARGGTSAGAQAAFLHVRLIPCLVRDSLERGAASVAHAVNRTAPAQPTADVVTPSMNHKAAGQVGSQRAHRAHGGTSAGFRDAAPAFGASVVSKPPDAGNPVWAYLSMLVGTALASSAALFQRRRSRGEFAAVNATVEPR